MATESAKHNFQTNGPGVIGSDLCTICGKERQDHEITAPMPDGIGPEVAANYGDPENDAVETPEIIKAANAGTLYADAKPAEVSIEAFAKELIRASWGGCDGGDIIQEVALKHGLIEQVPFNPEIHSDVDGYGYEAGDPWFVFAGPLAASAEQPNDALKLVLALGLGAVQS